MLFILFNIYFYLFIFLLLDYVNVNNILTTGQPTQPPPSAKIKQSKPGRCCTFYFIMNFADL